MHQSMDFAVDSRYHRSALLGYPKIGLDSTVRQLRDRLQGCQASIQAGLVTSQTV